MSASRRSTAATRRAARWTAVWCIVLGGVAALLLAPATLHLVREQLHINCSTSPPGTEGAGSWSCADGIGYLGVAVALGGMTVILTGAATVVSGIMDAGRITRGLLTMIAVTSAGWILLWTWSGSAAVAGVTPPDVSPSDYWGSAVGPAAAAAVIGAVIAGLSIAFRGRVAQALGGCAAASFAVSTVLQIGIAPGTVLAAAVMIAATLRTES